MHATNGEYRTWDLLMAFTASIRSAVCKKYEAFWSYSLIYFKIVNDVNK